MWPKSVHFIWPFLAQFILPRTASSLIGFAGIEMVIVPKKFTCEEALAYTGQLNEMKRLARIRLDEFEQKKKLTQLVRRLSRDQSVGEQLSPNLDQDQILLEAVSYSYEQTLNHTEQTFCADSSNSKMAISNANSREEFFVQIRKEEARKHIPWVAIVVASGITCLMWKRSMQK